MDGVVCVVCVVWCGVVWCAGKAGYWTMDGVWCIQCVDVAGLRSTDVQYCGDSVGQGCMRIVRVESDAWERCEKGAGGTLDCVCSSGDNRKRVRERVLW